MPRCAAWWATVAGGLAPALLAAVALAGCGGLPGRGLPGGGLPDAGRSASPAAVPEPLRELATTTIRLGDRPLWVAVADSPAARQRGLMNVADLGPLDGLLFAYPDPVDTAFHMRDVPIPLDIAFFDAEGRTLAVLQMAVCPAEPCPSYRSPAQFRWALETEAGALADLAEGTLLRLSP